MKTITQEQRVELNTLAYNAEYYYEIYRKLNSKDAKVKYLSYSKQYNDMYKKLHGQSTN